MNDLTTLKNKHVLVTGSDGFIGSHLVEALVKEGCAIRAFVYYNSFNHWGWLDTLSKEALKDVEIFMGDIRDPSCVREAMKGIDVVFHLAALIGIPYSYYSPESYADTNVKGTLNVLQAAREAQSQRILITSTSEVYGTAEYVPIDEQHPLKAQSPYSATKIGADKLAESYFKSFGSPVTIVRPFNTFGPRQSARAIIPTIITQLIDGHNDIHLGAMTPTRDFVYVKDTVQGFIAIATSLKTLGEEVNIATQNEISMGDLADTLIQLINPEARIVTDQEKLRPKESEVERLLGSNDKIKRLTDWENRYTFKKGLQETIEWFRDRENMSKYKSDIYNI